MKRHLRSFAVLCALAGVVLPCFTFTLNAPAQSASAPGATAPPSLIAPRRLIVPCQGPGGAPVEYTVALPNRHDTNGVIECRPPSGTLFPVGTNTVVCLATDAAGVRSSAMFPVIVVGGCASDECLRLQVPPDIRVRCGAGGVTKVDFEATASNLCPGGQVEVLCVPSPGSSFPVGATRVVCSAAQDTRKASACFLVEVIDDTPPEIQCPTNRVVEAQSPLGAIVRYEVSAKDDCAARVQVRCAPPSGAVFAVGETRVSCRAADGHGNLSTCAFTVKVNPAPPLRATRLDSNRVELRWTGDATLEGTDALNGEAPWETIHETPREEGNDRMLEVASSAPYRFFRTRPTPLLAPADRDHDGIPDSLDSCPDTPAGLAVDEDGVSLLELVSTPEPALGAEREALAGTLHDLELAGGFSNLVERLQTRLAPSNSPAVFLRARDLPAALQAQSNLVAELSRALTEFPREKSFRIVQLQLAATPLDAAHADVRPEDLEIYRLDDIEEGLTSELSRGRRTLLTLSNLVDATSERRPRERVRILSLDAERGTAQLEDGRLLLLPRALSEAAPALEEIRDVYGPGSLVDLEASPLPDGSWYGFELQPPTGVSNSYTLEIDLTCLRLRVVPADPGLPVFDSGTRHDLRGYKWGFTPATSRHYLEFGMALAIERIDCPFEAPGAYQHWLEVREDVNNDGLFSYMMTYADESEPAHVLNAVTYGSPAPFPILVREYRRKLPAGAPELLKEETHIIEINGWGSYGQADYDRTIFELEDWPNETHYQAAQVVDVERQWPLLLQPLAQQTFSAQSYTVTGQGSTYPDVHDVHLNEPFAVQFQDPNNDLLFAYPQDVGRGLSGPTLSGINNGRPFTYRVGLPALVRDRLHDCGSSESYYRIPFLGPLGIGYYGGWQVSQGNNGQFTHKGAQRYAFDFPAKAGTFVLACRGGIVLKTQQSSSQSCYDPDFDDGDGPGGCTGCNGDKSPNLITIRHQDGTIGVYMHFQKNGVLVAKGQRVFRGDAIGRVGSTGCSTDPHVHVHVLQPDGSQTIPIRFECYDEDFQFRSCFLPPSDSEGFSTNKPWTWPF